MDENGQAEKNGIKSPQPPFSKGEEVEENHGAGVKVCVKCGYASASWPVEVWGVLERGVLKSSAAQYLRRCPRCLTLQGLPRAGACRVRGSRVKKGWKRWLVGVGWVVLEMVGRSAGFFHHKGTKGTKAGEGQE